VPDFGNLAHLRLLKFNHQSYHFFRRLILRHLDVPDFGNLAHLGYYRSACYAPGQELYT